LIIDDVKRLSATMTPKELERHFAKTFAQNPSGLLHAHGMAAKVERTKSANARTGELRTKVREFMKTHPDMPLHQAYRRVGAEMGLL
jgi:hypothetical protein